MTSYIVLKKYAPINPAIASSSSAAPFGWIEAGPPVEAVSADAAIRKAIDGDKGGTYVAVPLRSWSPITVKVETKRVLTLT